MWKDIYKIGVLQIDEQHKQLLLMASDLLSVIRTGGDNQSEIRQHMAFLKDYAKVHFKTEEMFQQSIGYPDCEAHKQLHDDFTQKLQDLDIDLMRTGYSAEAQSALADVLNKWWIYHIMREDKKMMNYL